MWLITDIERQNLGPRCLYKFLPRFLPLRFAVFSPCRHCQHCGAPKPAKQKLMIIVAMS